MKLHFDETMAGVVKTAAGERRFSFTVAADGPTLLGLVGWGPLTLGGTATLEGVVAGAPVLPGSRLEIGPPLHRYLRYQVHFRDAQGSYYRFFGQKTVYLLRLRRTMTTLRGSLFRDGELVGPATLYFALGDLPRFLWSFVVPAT